MGQGAVQGTLQRKLVLGTRGQKSQQEELRGDGARRGSRGDFSLSLESESGSNIVLIAVLVVFLSVLEEGSRPQVLHNKCFKISSSL